MAEKKFTVGQEVLWLPSQWRRKTPKALTEYLRKAVVTKVGRVNVTVETTEGHKTDSVFRIEDGWENTPNARSYSQNAARIFTPEDWEAHLRQDKAVKIFREFLQTHSYGSEARMDINDLEALTGIMETIMQKKAAK